MEDEQERCDGCNEVIMYESPENFDPVCMDEGGLVHAECCCACEVDDTGEVTFKTEKEGE